MNNDQCLEKIKNEPVDIIGVDMESASIGQVCYAICNYVFLAKRPFG